MDFAFGVGLGFGDERCRSGVSHSRTDYDGTWQRKVITYLEYKYLVLVSAKCGSSLLRYFYFWIFKVIQKLINLQMSSTLFR